MSKVQYAKIKQEFFDTRGKTPLATCNVVELPEVNDLYKDAVNSHNYFFKDDKGKPFVMQVTTHTRVLELK